MADKPTEPYFAPAAQGRGVTNAQAQPDGAPAWGEDATEIARSAGLGSYGPEPTAQQEREDALLRTLDGVGGSVAGLRVLVLVLCASVLALGAAVTWLWLQLPAAPP